MQAVQLLQAPLQTNQQVDDLATANKGQQGVSKLLCQAAFDENAGDIVFDLLSA